MRRYVCQRVLLALVTLFGITVVSFVVINMAPGGPFVEDLSPDISPDDIRQMEKNFGLDKPLHIRYGVWIRNLVTGEEVG